MIIPKQAPGGNSTKPLPSLEDQAAVCRWLDQHPVAPGDWSEDARGRTYVMVREGRCPICWRELPDPQLWSIYQDYGCKLLRGGRVLCRLWRPSLYGRPPGWRHVEYCPVLDGDIFLEERGEAR
jgi:hypothetical protein